MKNIKSLIILAIFASAVTAACNPIEDKDLRDEFSNSGTPVTRATLSEAISVTQPFPNEDGVIAGDQYVVIKNNRPDIGGAWHIGWGVGEKILNTDSDTLIYEANGTYNIYFVGISGNTIVRSDTTQITVTNVFDKWAGYLTGAENKADKTASKTWGFREVSWGSVCNMGAHGGWKYTSAGYTPESNFAWWASVNYSTAGDQTMVFEYDGSKMTTYNADGTVKARGVFAFLHNTPESGVLGTLITTAPTIGAAYDDCGQVTGGNNSFYLLTFTDQYITIYHNGWGGSADWDDCGWYAYFRAK
jgi:hypothetical protein